MRNIYIIAGQSNATATAPAIRDEILARDPFAIVLSVSSAGAPLTWARSGSDWQQSGDLRDRLVAEAAQAMTAHPDAVLRALVWVQGEADTLDCARPDAYANAFIDLLDRIDSGLRAALPEIPVRQLDFDVTTVGLSSFAPSAAGRANWAVVQEEQRRLDALSDRIGLIDTDTVGRSRGFDQSSMFRDPLHYTQSFIETLAGAVASTVAGSASATPSRHLIEGTNRADLLNGLGMDTIRAGEGSDTVNAGPGDDNVAGGGGNDLLYGGEGRNILWGINGNDTLHAGTGADRLFGGAGDDRLTAGRGDDLLDGGTDRDSLFGGIGRDTLGGGTGNDLLTGGQGTDRLTGGAGADVFLFLDASDMGLGTARDVITDFERGLDRIDLRGLQTTFNGQSGPIGGGTASCWQNLQTGLLMGDRNGDRIADWTLEVQGIARLDQSDFLL